MRITDFQKHNNLEHKTTEEILKEELEDIGEMQRGEAYYEAKRMEEIIDE